MTRPIDPAHDAFELALARGALERGIPVLGICRGIQVLAVADGGALTQHVAEQHEGARMHEYSWPDLAIAPPGDHWHEVEVEPGSSAEAWFEGGNRRVNSFHHQAVARTRCPPVADRAHARRRDRGHRAHRRSGWAAGVQWHNELMWRFDHRFLRPHTQLVAAARA